MERRSLATIASFLLLLAAPGSGHGGTYNGPGNGPPPGGGGGGGAPGGVADSVGSGNCSGGTPRPAPPPGGSSVPAPSGGSQTTTLARPGAGSPTAATVGNDETAWQRWWGFNQHAYLDVKGAIHAAAIGSDVFFLGRAPADHARDHLLPRQEQIRGQVVPALVAALEGERDADVVTGALIALAKIGDAEGEPSMAGWIEPYLADGNQEIAETAAVSLGILASPAAIAVLEDLLLDRDEGRRRVGHPAGVPLRTRAFAAYGLGLIGSRSSDDDLRRRIVRGLVETFEGDATGLATPDVAVACLGALGLVPLPMGADVESSPWNGREAQLRWLAERLSDETLRDTTRAHVPVAAARLATALEAELRTVWVRELCARLAERETPRLVRQGLVLGLGISATASDSDDDRAARAALLKAAGRGSDPDLRHFAWIALGQAAARPGEGDAPFAGTALVRAHLVRLLRKGTSMDRPWAALALGAMGRELMGHGVECDREVDAALREALADARGPHEVGALAIAAGMRRDPHAVGIVLAQLAEIADDDTRGYLCLALGMIGEPEGLGPVREVVRSSRYRPALLRQAAIALGLLGDKHLVPELCKALESAGSLAAQASVASGLGAIGDARSIEPLIAMLADREITPRARAFAAVALGIVADKEARPWNAKLAIGTHYRANTVTLTDGQGAGILEIL